MKAEQEIAKIIEGSETIEKLGIQFETLNARIRVQDKLQSNYDKSKLSCKQYNSVTVLYEVLSWNALDLSSYWTCKFLILIKLISFSHFHIVWKYYLLMPIALAKSWYTTSSIESAKLICDSELFSHDLYFFQ